MTTETATTETLTERRQRIRTFACPRPRCSGSVGQPCRTPNGHLVGFHADRVNLADGHTQPTRERRLTDRQAQWLEDAAESDAHRLYAPDQYATLRGDAARRATADAMLSAGLVRQVATEHGWRVFELTDAGWRTYWTHRLVIRRGTPEHPDTCPCRTTNPEAKPMDDQTVTAATTVFETLQKAEDLATASGDHKLAGDLYALGCWLGSPNRTENQ